MKGCYQDILSVERAPVPLRTDEMLKRIARLYINASALNFFLRAEDYQHPFRWSHTEIFADITQPPDAACWPAMSSAVKLSSCIHFQLKTS